MVFQRTLCNLALTIIWLVQALIVEEEQSEGPVEGLKGNGELNYTAEVWKDTVILPQRSTRSPLCDHSFNGRTEVGEEDVKSAIIDVGYRRMIRITNLINYR